MNASTHTEHSRRKCYCGDEGIHTGGKFLTFNYMILYIYDVLLFEFSPQLACETFIKNMNYVEKLSTYNSCLPGFCIHVVFALSQPQGKNAIRFKDLRKG